MKRNKSRGKERKKGHRNRKMEEEDRNRIKLSVNNYSGFELVVSDSYPDGSASCHYTFREASGTRYIILEQKVIVKEAVITDGVMKKGCVTDGVVLGESFGLSGELLEGGGNEVTLNITKAPLIKRRGKRSTHS